MEIVSSEKMAWVQYPGQRANSTRYKAMFKGVPKSRDNFELSIIQIGEGGSFSPRHRHNFEQFRVPLNQAFNQSPKQDIPKDYIGYIGEGTSYGPQDVAAHTEFVLLQAGGPSGAGYMSHDELMQGTKELKEMGEFSGGVFRRSEKGGHAKKNNQDAYEAVWEQVNGKRIEYAQARYREPITIDPKAFNWVPVEGSSGVSEKHLGTYNELGTGVSQLRLENASSYKVTAIRGRKLLVIMEGSLSVYKQHLRQWSGVNLSPGESADVISDGGPPAVVLVLQLPTFPP